MAGLESSKAGGRGVHASEAVRFTRTSPGAGRQVLIVAGDLDIASSALLRRELDGLLDDGVAALEIDLSGVVFMDSSALGVLVAAHERAKAGGLKLALARPSAACTKVLGITGLDRVFDFV